MVRVPELYFLNKDVKALRRRLAWLDERIARRETNAPGSGFDRAEREMLVRVLSQVDAKGEACDPPSKEAQADADAHLPGRALAAVMGD